MSGPARRALLHRVFRRASPGLWSRPSGHDPSRKSFPGQPLYEADATRLGRRNAGRGSQNRDGALRLDAQGRQSLLRSPQKTFSRRFAFLTPRPAHWRRPSRVACATPFGREKETTHGRRSGPRQSTTHRGTKRRVPPGFLHPLVRTAGRCLATCCAPAESPPCPRKSKSKSGPPSRNSTTRATILSTTTTTIPMASATSARS